MSISIPPLGPAPADRTRGESSLSRRSLRELARIYISASAWSAALDTLDRLGSATWDEETRLLRAEALLGLGQVPEAEALLGPPMIPGYHEDAPSSPRPAGPLLPRVRPGEKARVPVRRERLELWRFLLQLRILHRTGRYRLVLGLGRAFFLSRDVQPGLHVARIASVVAQSMLALRQPAEACALYEEILELYKGLRSTEGQADVLLGMANANLLDCHWDRADALYQEAKFRYEELGQSDKALACLINLGVLRGKRGDLLGGRTLLQQALGRCAQIGDERRSYTVLLGLAMIETRMGEFFAARRRLLAVLRAARRSHAIRNRGLALEFLGALYLHQRRLRRARVVLDLGLRIAREIAPEGDLYFEIRRLQAELALAEKSYTEARILGAEAQSLAIRFGDEYEAAVVERVLAEIDTAQGKFDAARERAASARTALARLGQTYERARLDLLALRLELSARGLPARVIHERLEAACRPFLELPDAPLVREADSLGTGEGWNVSAAARDLGVSRAALARSLRPATGARGAMRRSRAR